jgi:hypothetical protein
MTYEERTNAIGSWLRDVVLPRYNRPDHLGDAEARAEVADMVEDINAETPILPVDAFEPFLATMFAKLRRTYTGRNWPPIGAFCKAIAAARKDGPRTPPGEYAPDDYAIAAAKMKAREPVGQDYVYGPKCKELLRRGLVSFDDIAAYRAGVFQMLRDTYGKQDALLMVDLMLAEHNASQFPTSADDLDAARSVRIRRM